MNSTFSIKFYLVTIVFALITAGCSAAKLNSPPASEPVPYKSEIADKDAKAFYFYTQFRMLATDSRWDEAIAALRQAVAFDPDALYLRMVLAKALLHQEQQDESIQILQQVINEAPEYAQGHELLGDLLSYQEQYAAAVEHYRTALELTPAREMLQLRLAITLGRMGQNPAAIEVLESLVNEDPDALQARLALARFYFAEKQNGPAKELYRRILETHPGHPQAILEYGKILETEQLIAEAFALYRAEINRNPRAAVIRQRLAALYIQQRRLPEALQQFQAIRQQSPNNSEIIGRIGLLQLEMEEWTAAEENFRTLLAGGENRGRNRYYLGLALLGQGKNSEAIDIMSPIDESSPVFAETVLQLAFLYRQAGQVDEAIDALLHLLQIDIFRPIVYFYLSSFYEEQGRLSEALEISRQGIEKFPQEVDLLYQRGVLFEKSDRRELALEVMQKILTLNPEHADALNYIAYHHAEKGTELELALSRAQKALAAKKAGYIIDTLGWIYFKMGRYDESREQLEEASTLHPDDAVILEHLADLYRALRLWDKAGDTYRRALEINPEAEEVRRKLKSLPQENSL